jgi:hypothetical protein
MNISYDSSIFETKNSTQKQSKKSFGGTEGIDTVFLMFTLPKGSRQTFSTY